MKRTAIVIIALAVGGAAAWALVVRSERLRRVPPTPDLAAAPAVLRARIETVETAARAGERGALAELAQLYHVNGYARPAEQAYRGLIEAEPAEPRWRYLGGLLLAGYGRLDEAEPWLRQAAEAAPRYVPVQLKLGDLHLKSNRPGEAAAAFEAALAADPDSAWAQHGLARLAVADGRWPEARRRLEAIVARQPDFFAANSLLATVYERLGESAAAELPRRRARAAERFREPPDPWLEALSELCFDAYRLRVMASATADAGRARALLERALSLEPDNPKVMRQLALLHLESEALEPAREWIDRAVALAPDEPAGYLDLVPIYHAQGDRAGAARMLRQGLARAPQAAGLHYELAMIAIADERLDEAVAYLEEARRLDPGELAADAKLANLYFRLGRADAAVAVLDAALARDPNHGPTLVLAARHHAMHGRRSEARALAERALVVGEVSPELEALRRELGL